MNREIKFRAWLKKKMVEVEEINFTHKEIRFKDYKTPFTKPIEVNVLFEDIELMQYTGLKDKNGVEIYDGDIVKTPNRKGKIQFIWSGWYFHTDKDGFVELHDVTDIMEVIGNIYENKELLEN